MVNENQVGNAYSVFPPLLFRSRSAVFLTLPERKSSGYLIADLDVFALPCRDHAGVRLDNTCPTKYERAQQNIEPRLHHKKLEMSFSNRLRQKRQLVQRDNEPYLIRVQPEISIMINHTLVCEMLSKTTSKRNQRELLDYPSRTLGFGVFPM